MNGIAIMRLKRVPCTDVGLQIPEVAVGPVVALLLLSLFVFFRCWWWRDVGQGFGCSEMFLCVKGRWFEFGNGVVEVKGHGGKGNGG